MGVLNFAHGVLITIGAYSAWWVGDQVAGPAEARLLAGTAFALLVGAVMGAAIELVFIRPLYRRPIEQILVTVGLALALGALIVGIFGPETKPPIVPGWMIDTTMVLGEPVPNDRFVEIAVAAIVLVGLIAFLRYTRYGLVIRAGVENRSMVTALGVDVQRAFTLVFALGGALAALAGVLSNVYFASVEPGRGTSLLIYAFIVVVIGGFGSIGGAAVAGVAVALLQNYANYYGTTGAGDMAVVVLLAVTLLLRPHGLSPKVAH
jgi:branched-chain amino acid transport system permease protein